VSVIKKKSLNKRANYSSSNVQGLEMILTLNTGCSSTRQLRRDVPSNTGFLESLNISCKMCVLVRQCSGFDRNKFTMYFSNL
jgi:hypothetical protein